MSDGVQTDEAIRGGDVTGTFRFDVDGSRASFDDVQGEFRVRLVVPDEVQALPLAERREWVQRVTRGVQALKDSLAGVGPASHEPARDKPGMPSEIVVQANLGRSGEYRVFVDGAEFPWWISDEGVEVVPVSRYNVPGVKLTILAERVRADHSIDLQEPLEVAQHGVPVRKPVDEVAGGRASG